MLSDKVFVLIIIATTVVLPLLMLGYFVRRHLNLREKEIGVGQKQLEQRIRVLEQIATDSGARTALQIEALKDASSEHGP